MPIFEKIQDAEMQAEKLKTKAKEEVTKLLEENDSKNKEIIQEKNNAAKVVVDAMNIEVQNKIDELEALSNEECCKINNQNEENAKKQFDKTMDFIVKKVISS